MAIYGAKCLRKITVLIAARALNWLATESSSRSQPDAKIPPYQPFLLDEESRTSPIELGCDVVIQDHLEIYIAYVHNSSSRKHSLLDGKGEVKLIDRRPSGEVHGELISRSDANQLYVKAMQPNVTVLSKLAQHGPHRGKESVQPYYRAIRNATRYADYSGAATILWGLGRTRDERFARDIQYREWIMNHLIKGADVGICDVRTRLEKVKLPEAMRESLETNAEFPDTLMAVSFVHDGNSKQPIDFSTESSGTKKLFNIAGDWWTLANEQGPSLRMNSVQASPPLARPPDPSRQ